MYGSGKVALTVGQLRSIYGQLHGILEQRMAQLLGGGQMYNENEYEEEQVRREVQLRLQEYLFRVMDMASDSIEVVDAEEGKSIRRLIMESREKFLEPFDVDLNERVREEYHQWEDANVKISQLRRRGPEAVRSLYAAEQDKYLGEIDDKIERLQLDNEKLTERKEDKEEQENEAATPEQQEVFLTALKSLMDTQARIPDIRSELDTTTNLVAYLDNA